MAKKPISTAYIALVLVSFFWGTTYLATRIGVEYAHGFYLSAVRQTLAGVLLVGFMLIRGYKFPDKKTMFQMTVLGFLMLCAGNGLMTWSMQYIESSLGAVLSATGPIWVAIMSHFLVAKMKWSIRLVGGMLLGIGGIAGIFYDYLSYFLDPKFSFGILLCMLATLIWSLGSVLAAKWKPSIHLLMGAGLQMLFGGIAMWLVVGLMGWAGTEMIFKPLGWEFWGSIGYLIIFGSFVAYSAFLYTLEKLPAAQASLYAYINPVVAVFLGWLILSEKLNWITVLSMLTTVGGVFLVNTAFERQRRRLVPAPRAMGSTTEIVEVKPEEREEKEELVDIH